MLSTINLSRSRKTKIPHDSRGKDSAYQLLPLRTREVPDTEELRLIGLHSNGWHDRKWTVDPFEQAEIHLAFVLKDRYSHTSQTICLAYTVFAIKQCP